MKKALVHFNFGPERNHHNPTQVHIVKEDYLTMRDTLCGKYLHPKSTAYIYGDEIPVTCKKCKAMYQKAIT